MGGQREQSDEPAGFGYGHAGQPDVLRWRLPGAVTYARNTTVWQFPVWPVIPACWPATPASRLVCCYGLQLTTWLYPGTIGHVDNVMGGLFIQELKLIHTSA